MPNLIAHTNPVATSARSLMPWSVQINYALAEARYVALCLLWPLAMAALGTVIICIFDDMQATWAVIPYWAGWVVWLYGICSFGGRSYRKRKAVSRD